HPQGRTLHGSTGCGCAQPSERGMRAALFRGLVGVRTQRDAGATQGCRHVSTEGNTMKTVYIAGGLAAALAVPLIAAAPAPAATGATTTATTTAATTTA